MNIVQQNKSVFMGNSFFGRQDMDIKERIAMKKQLHQKEALHVVGVTNKSEKKLDANVEEMRNNIRKLQDENKSANAFYQEYQQKIAQAKEDYGVSDDSQEQKDLELLMKQFDIRTHGKSSRGELTEEEEKYLENMGELTEYQQLAMEAYKQADNYKTTIEKNNLNMIAEAATIRMIGQERLKTHAMVDAKKVEEEIMAGASDEAIGMMVDDAKEKLDEKAEELQEAADKRQEKEEEQEERIEAAKENKAEVEAAVENAQENAENLTEQAVNGEDVMEDVDAQVKKIMEEQKLLEEEMKGLLVSAKV